MLRLLILPTVVLAAIGAGRLQAMGPADAGQQPPRLSFNKDIRPILSENCFACHGPDNASREAGLRLDRFDHATQRLESGSRAIVPGKINESEAIARITSNDPDTVMPPPKAKIGRLSPEQVAAVKRWISEGAEYEPHWAFVPPARPMADDASREVDRLVEGSLSRRGLALQREADRTTLIRRASYDITGLPPTPAEVRGFVGDASPDAYEKLLDRLLSSPRYGERMAADWMDLARYADSYGFQVDRPRPTMWPWRDWVIRAFNDNLPWDQFTLWQLAGDLLPGATDEQILATAFNRLHPQEAEGGSVEEEYRVNYVNDRVVTFGTAFLGLTLECCRCHDHKFDPLTQKDFYSLFAFFDDIDEAGLYSFFTEAVPTPKMRLLDAADASRLARADRVCDEAASALAQSEKAAIEAARAWLSGTAARPAELGSPAAAVISGEIVRYGFDERRPDGRFANLVGPAQTDQPAASPPADLAAKSSRENTLVDGRLGDAIRLTGDHGVETPVGNFRRSQPFTVSLWLNAPSMFDRAVVFHRSKAWTDAGSRGYELIVDGGHLRWSLIHFWPGDAASVRTREPLAAGKWTHVAVTSDGSGKAAGLGIFIDGRPAATGVVRDGLTREIIGGGGDHITIGERMRDNGFKNGLVDDFRVFDRELSPLEVRETFEPGAIRAAIDAKQPAELVAGYFAAAVDGASRAKRKALQEARRTRDDLAEKLPEIMVMRDLAKPRTAYVLERGEYDKRRQPVEPDTPASLPPFPVHEPRNRLGLARWLIAPDHPLLARVTVNRLWQSLFGLGLVQSPEDLGSQSTQPEHREVLDLLAWKFSHPVAEGGFGWDMKRLMKTIMLSRTYRQRSMADERTMADDPQNVWLARGPRHRLPAEMIRDGLLASCGLLVERVGGPPVKTCDMPESFKPEKADEGDSRYRRSLYTYWRRTGPAPMLESFDVPKRVVCVAKRDATNTPLHAVVLMNGPQFVEAARVLAERLLADADRQPGRAVEIAFERLTSRPPDEEEKRVLHRMIVEQRKWYADRPLEAEKYVAIGEAKRDESLPVVDVAAAASVINALMNYDGSLVKR